MHRPGKETNEPDRHLCQCKLVEDPTAKIVVVEFKYLPHKWLVMKGLKNEANEEPMSFILFYFLILPSSPSLYLCLSLHCLAIMVQLSDGGEVSILIAESVAQEYQVEEKTKDGVTTCTCCELKKCPVVLLRSCALFLSISR